jgi:hypothetical protein
MYRQVTLGLLSFVFLFLANCSYQNKAKYLEKVQGNNIKTDDKKNNDGNDGNNGDDNQGGDSGDNNIIDERISKEVYTQSLESFYNEFVVRISDNPINTAIDYEKLHLKLVKQPDKNTIDLMKKIETYIGAYKDSGEIDNAEDAALYMNAYNFHIIKLISENLYDKNNVKVKTIFEVTRVLNEKIREENKDLDQENQKAEIKNIFKDKYFVLARKFMPFDTIEKLYVYSYLTKKASKQDGSDIFKYRKIKFDEEKGALIKKEDGTLDFETEVLSVKRKEAISLDARFHFSVICGATGCPVLNQELYKAETLDEQLSEITKLGLEQPRNLVMNGKNPKVTFLFDWYANDFKKHFENDESSELSFIKKYSQEDLSKATKIELQSYYCWDLNSPENGADKCENP